MDGQHSFEQKLSLMLQRIGVTKPPPPEDQVSNQGNTALMELDIIMGFNEC